MDFVNQAYSQLIELIRSMSAGTRVATGLLLVLVTISLVYLFQYHVNGGDELLLSGRPFTQSEMTAIEAAFAKAKLGMTQQKQKTASVTVQTRGGQLEEDQVKAIRNVVASAYAGLDRRNITITDLSGATYGGAIGPDGMPEDESVYASHKLRYERSYQLKIQSQLTYIPGVIVNVNADLNPEMHHSSTTTKYDPKPVTLLSTESTKEAKTRSPGVA